MVLGLNAIPEKDLVYVSSLPDLLRAVVVIKDGKELSYEEMPETPRDFWLTPK